ncbi:diguanylate cyclase [Pseudomonas sp. RIT623]|nr:diguanylate cyclase [Pseudomonas sp. RIT623]
MYQCVDAGLPANNGAAGAIHCGAGFASKLAPTGRLVRERALT